MSNGEEWRADAEDEHPGERVVYPTISFDQIDEHKTRYKVGVHVSGRPVPFSFEESGAALKQKITDACGGDVSKIQKIEVVEEY